MAKIRKVLKSNYSTENWNFTVEYYTGNYRSYYCTTPKTVKDFIDNVDVGNTVVLKDSFGTMIYYHDTTNDAKSIESYLKERNEKHALNDLVYRY